MYPKIVTELIKSSNLKSTNKKELGENECEQELDELHKILKTAEKKLIIKQGLNKFRKRAHKKSKSWWCSTLSKLVVKRNGAHRLFKQLKSPVFKLIHARLNVAIKKVSRKRKRYVAWLERQKMIKKYQANPNLFWRDIKQKRGDKVQVDISPEELRSKYEDNFNSLQQTESSMRLQLKMENAVAKYEARVRASKTFYPVCVDVVRDALKSLKNNKCAGKSGVSNELLKYSRDTQISEVVRTILESMLNGCFCSTNINIGYIITIIKDATGNPKDSDNTRPITISETISMVLEEMVMRDVLRKCKLNRHQFGFRANSSCAHAIFSIKEIALDARKNGRNAIGLFLDFSKAFDKVNRTKLWYALIKNASPKYWLLLKNYYRQMKTYVIDEEGGYTEPFESKVGVKQGGKLSPFLYNLLVNDLLNILENSKLTYRIGNTYKGILVYADDTNIICESLHNLNLIIKLIERFCSDYDIKINAKKTKWMRLTPNYSIEEGMVQIGEVPIEEVFEFKFLGVIIRSDGSHTTHLKNRRKLYLKGIAEINSLGFSDKDTPANIKKILYTSLVRSKLAYGLETCNFKPKEIHTLLNTLEANQIKKAYELSRFSKSKILLYALNISPFEVYLLKRKISFLKQLANNEATQELLINGNHESLESVLTHLGVDHSEEARKDSVGYMDLIRRRCKAKLKEIENMETLIKKCAVVKSVRYLLNNRNKDNDDTVQYLLDPRRYSCG